MLKGYAQEAIPSLVMLCAQALQLERYESICFPSCTGSQMVHTTTACAKAAGYAGEVPGPLLEFSDGCILDQVLPLI